MTGIFNCSVGVGQAGPAVAAGDNVIKYLGASLTPGAGAAAALTVGYPSGLSTVLATLGGPAAGGTVGGTIPGVMMVNGGAIFYTLSGAGATAQIYWETG